MLPGSACNKHDLKLLSDTLTGHGFRVHQAQDADEAMAMLTTVVPELILLDLYLPGMDGVSLARKIKGDGRFGAVRVIALTGLSSESSEGRELSTEFDGWITKPIGAVSFPETLLRFMRSAPNAAVRVELPATSDHGSVGAGGSSAHNMRCRLNGVIGFSELLLAEKAGPLNEKQRRYVTAVLTSGKELPQLLDTL
jgi:two-component system, cell cycle response regulator DivK